MNTTRSTRLLALTLAATAASVVVVGPAARHRSPTGVGSASIGEVHRLAVAQRPVILPNVLLRSADGHVIALRTLFSHDAPAIVVFVYTRCLPACSPFGAALQQMQERLRSRGLAGRVRLVAISFDAADENRALEAYGKRTDSDRATWRLYSVPNPVARSRAVDAFGVNVMPAPLGEYLHKVAFHVVDRYARLRGSFGDEESDAALRAALAAES